MNILIADDETPARSELRYVLEALEPGAAFFEASNGEEVLRLVESEPIQVAFLDIRMPGLDGLAVAATLMDGPEPPLIVFATAYDEHALEAFELAALDYVMKPFDERRLTLTMDRVRQALSERAVLDRRRANLREYLLTAAPDSGLTRLWCEQATGNWLLVDYHDILWLVADDKRVYACTASGEKLPVRHTLKELEPRLLAYDFARVHKSYLVNLKYVAEVVPWFSGTYVVRMADAGRTEIPLSRRYAAHLKKLTGY